MTPNVPLMRKILDRIEEDPSTWVQTQWVSEGACGTAYCVAGWALCLTGHELKVGSDDGMILDGVPDRHGGHVTEAAREELGLNPDQAGRLFSSKNTYAQIRTQCMELAELAGDRL